MSEIFTMPTPHVVELRRKIIELERQLELAAQIYARDISRLQAQVAELEAELKARPKGVGVGKWSLPK